MTLLKILNRFADLPFKGIEFLVRLLSFEWILTSTNRPNGGDIVLVRSLLVSLWMYCLFIGITHAADSNRLSVFSLEQFWSEFGKSLAVFGALLAAIYLALYARFSAQWSYLAQLYNQIKNAEVTADPEKSRDALAKWKAGFLEDAEELHLATKRTFSPIIKAWAAEELVAAAYRSHTPGGQARLDKLKGKVEIAYEKISKSYV